MFNSYNGFGTEQEAPPLNDLMKALTAGYTFGVTDQAGGAALRVESLEASLRVLTYSDQHVRFWKNIPKMQAYNTVEEYNTLSAYGDNSSAFLPEGVAPETNDSTYARNIALIKYMGTSASVTHVATLMRAANGDVIARENQNRILWLLRQIEHALFWGNDQLVFNYSSASGGATGPEWRGLDASIDSASYIDAAGASLSEGLLNDSASTLASNFANATHCYMPYKVKTDYDKTLFSKERIILPSPDGGIATGTNASKFHGSFGDIELVPDVFLTKNRKAASNSNPGVGTNGAPSAATSAQAPQTPASISGAGATGSDGLWKQTGTVYYKVTAINRYGESASTAASSGVVISSLTTHTVLTVTNPNPISGLIPDYFNIYRSDTGSTGVFWYIASVAAGSVSSGGTTSYTDTGLYMTNVSTAFIGQFDSNILAMKQLAPLMKMDLAVLGPAIRWMILFYATFVLYQPKKWLKIINIGDLS